MKIPKSIVLIGLFLMNVLVVAGQPDSVKVSKVNPEYEFIYRELFNFSPNSTFGNIELATVPHFLPNYRFHPDIMFDVHSFLGMKSISLSNQSPYMNPFLNSFMITSQADYRLNDRFTLGGNSFAGNSIFSPLPASSLQDMSIRGASMYLQYKISEKFKIGGGFSISSQDSPFIP